MNNAFQWAIGLGSLSVLLALVITLAIHWFVYLTRDGKDD